MQREGKAGQRLIYAVYAKTVAVALVLVVAMLTVVPWYVGGLLYLGYVYLPVIPQNARRVTYRTGMERKSVRADIEPPAPVFDWLARGRAERIERDGDSIRYVRDGRVGGFDTVLTVSDTGPNSYDLTFESEDETKHNRLTLRSVEDGTELVIEQPDRPGWTTVNTFTTEQLTAWFESRVLAARGYRKVTDSDEV